MAARKKRALTRYSILVGHESEADLATLTCPLHLVGTVEAYTRPQAQRRAVGEIPAVAQLAARYDDAVDLYAVPVRAMTPDRVTVDKTPRAKGADQ